MAYPAAITLDDVQRLLYGANLGLSLPARDPWSFSTADEILRQDIPDLQPWFATAGSVTVLEQLAVYAGAGFAADDPGVALQPAYELRLRRSPSPAGADDTPSDDRPPGDHSSTAGARSVEVRHRQGDLHAKICSETGKHPAVCSPNDAYG